jgi:hypothetical protein
MKKINLIKFIASGVTVAALLTACAPLDVVQKDAVRAFGDVLKLLPSEEYEQSRWRLTAPDGTAWFAFDNMSMDMAVDAEPFVSAGADLSKLPNSGEHNLNPGRDSIWFMSQGFDMLNQNVKDSPLEQFNRDVAFLRRYLGYHEDMEHYNIDLNGAVFEWAKDLSTVEKTGKNQELDIVFALNPEPLIAAGVEPGKVEGWSYDTVKVMADGRETDVYRFLKPFDLKQNDYD